MSHPPKKETAFLSRMLRNGAKSWNSERTMAVCAVVTLAIFIRSSCFSPIPPVPEPGPPSPFGVGISIDDLLAHLSSDEQDEPPPPPQAMALAHQIWDILGGKENTVVAGERSLSREEALAVERKIAIVETLIPNHSLVYFLKGALDSQEGKSIEAIEFYKKALASNPKFSQAMAAIGYQYSLIPEWGNSIDWYEAAISFTPNPYYLHNLSMVYGNSGDYENGIRCAMQAFDIDGTDPAFSYQLAVMLERSGDFAAAETYIDVSISLDSESSDAAWSHYERGRIFYLKEDDDFPEAIKSFRKALLLNWQLEAAHSGLVWGLIDNDQHGEASEALEVAQAIFPDNRLLLKAEIELKNGSKSPGSSLALPPPHER